jgi:hypothetical protein
VCSKGPFIINPSVGYTDEGGQTCTYSVLNASNTQSMVTDVARCGFNEAGKAYCPLKQGNYSLFVSEFQTGYEFISADPTIQCHLDAKSYECEQVLKLLENQSVANLVKGEYFVDNYQELVGVSSCVLTALFPEYAKLPGSNSVYFASTILTALVLSLF